MSFNEILTGRAPSGLTDSRFNAVLYTGTRPSSQTINTGFKPDFGFVFPRSFADHKTVWDTTRGNTACSGLQEQGAEYDFSGGLTAITSSGFTVANTGQLNTNGGTLHAFVWGANGGTTSSNSNGSITSTVQTHSGGGFSVITWTGTGSDGTIGHGLSAEPQLIWVKTRSHTSDWVMYSPELASTSHRIVVGTSQGAQNTDNNPWNSTAATDTVFSVKGDAGNVNLNTRTFVGYAWANVTGYRKFGTYTANGNANGPSVTTGFQPDFLMIKNLDKDQEWIIKSRVSDSSNPSTTSLSMRGVSGTHAETQGNDVDFNSDGFQIKVSGSGINYQSGDTMWFWAEKIKTS
tara:strand:- start:182 stop:1222 length:1041 start_codon:yes stop_codon:yes gene_type:complete